MKPSELIYRLITESDMSDDDIEQIMLDIMERFYAGDIDEHEAMEEFRERTNNSLDEDDYAEFYSHLIDSEHEDVDEEED